MLPRSSSRPPIRAPGCGRWPPPRSGTYRARCRAGWEPTPTVAGLQPQPERPTPEPAPEPAGLRVGKRAGGIQLSGATLATPSKRVSMTATTAAPDRRHGGTGPVDRHQRRCRHGRCGAPVQAAERVVGDDGGGTKNADGSLTARAPFEDGPLHGGAGDGPREVGVGPHVGVLGQRHRVVDPGAVDHRSGEHAHVAHTDLGGSVEHPGHDRQFEFVGRRVVDVGRDRRGEMHDRSRSGEHRRQIVGGKVDPLHVEAGPRVDGGFVDGPHVDPFAVVDEAAHDARSHRTGRAGDHHHGVLVRVVLEATSGIHAPTMPS